MFRITKDPSSGSDDLYFEITCNGSQIFIMFVDWCLAAYSEPVVCVCVVTGWKLCDPKHVGVIFNYVFFKLL